MEIYKLEYFFQSESRMLDDYDYIRNIDKPKYIIINLDNITTITIINKNQDYWAEHFSIVQMNENTFFYIKEDSFNSLMEHLNSLNK